MSKLPYAIAGGGLMGASLAYHLAKKGEPVLLIDDSRVGRASNWNPGGINPLHGPGFPDVMQDVYRESYNLHLTEYKKIFELAGIDFNWKVVNRLFLAKDDVEMRVLEKTIQFYQEMPNFSAKLLAATDLVKFDNRINPKLKGGLLTIGNVSVQSENFRLALLAAAQKLGAKFYNGTLTKVISKNDEIKSVEFGLGDTEVIGLCMALGSWDNQKIEGWCPVIPTQIHSVIGDLLFVKSTGKRLGADIGSGINAVYQYDDYHYWIGGTTRKIDTLNESMDTIKHELLSKIEEILPGWHSFALLSHASAARPMTKDGLPLLGPIAPYKNAWVMNGGGSKGVLLSLWMGHVLSQIMTTGLIPNKITQFLPRK